ncbi:SurA N-terminal domain-containing protein [Candidatus Saccharibacteria bacterium]|nr:SurA N-terminal domain-containing protein [Candidatus Saccharibacteria bacterium]
MKLDLRGKSKKTSAPRKVAERKTEKEKVEERREEVLARGRKFKYPLQYAKHRLVVNTIVIGVVAVVLLVVIGGLALYRFQDTGDVMYRISRIIPVSVAEIDGEKVRFSDYLMILRSSLTVFKQQSGEISSIRTGTAGEDGEGNDEEAMKLEYKRTALEQAEDYVYAMKLARELGVEVTDEEVEKVFDQHRKVGGVERSEESFLKVLNSNFGYSKDEYLRMLYLLLVKSKVEEKVDDHAREIAAEVERKLAENGGDYGKVAEELKGEVDIDSTNGLVDVKNVDGGRAVKAAELEVGANSGRFLSTNGDGYYYLRVLEKTETQVSYVSLKIPFKEFEKEVKAVREAGKVKEYIDLKREEE